MLELASGTVVCERYVLDRLLGEGGMGVVWAATHTITRKPVALKFLQGANATDPTLRQRFLREARTACAVSHPNVVAVHDVLATDDGAPFMVMDLLLGEPLSHRLAREKRLSLAETASILLPVASATSAAHALGIVHRDLKPDNIFLAIDGDEQVKVQVLDFGIAKLTAVDGVAASTSALTVDGGVLGTPFYMSPEQVDGEKDVDHRSDIWSLGVILYECLSGTVPTYAENIGQVFKIITRGTIPPLSEVAPEVPEEVSRLVAAMMSKERKERPQSVREVIDALRPASGLAVIPGRDSLPDRRIVVSTDPSHPRIDRSLGESPTIDAVSLTVPGRRATPKLAAAGALIVLLGGIGAWVWGHHPPASPAALASPLATATGASAPPGAPARSEASSEASSPAQAPAGPSPAAPVPTASVAAGRAAPRSTAEPASHAKPRPTSAADAGAPSHPSNQAGPGGVVENPPF
jgi:serine/threonine protein kinase